MPGDVRSNALDDLLDAERHFRGQAEHAVRELRSVLTELALSIAGSQIEDARRTDPTAPESWGPERWRKFFTSLPRQAGASGWNGNQSLELEDLKNENQALKDQLVSLTPVLFQLSDRSNADNCSEPPAVDPPPNEGAPKSLSQTDNPPALEAPGLESTSFTHLELLNELRSLRLPATLPARFETHFPRGKLTDADLERQVRRKLYVLYLLGRGLNIRLEIDHLISQVERVGARTGALRRIYDSMVEKNLVSSEVLEMSAPNTSLAMLQLTQDGRELSQILAWEICESERERLNRLHQGMQFPQHTLGVMIFAMHARFRGYRVGVLPQVEGVETNAVPDGFISRRLKDGSLETNYVEVELSSKELDAKWHNLSQLQGHVALCARSEKRRVRLVGDCKLKKLHGLATDLETLIACKVPDISEDTPLWADEW
jgi:hypothetical protein